jgi:hypothetical protein
MGKENKNKLWTTNKSGRATCRVDKAEGGDEDQGENQGKTITKTNEVGIQGRHDYRGLQFTVHYVLRYQGIREKRK